MTIDMMDVLINGLIATGVFVFIGIAILVLLSQAWEVIRNELIK